MVSTEELLKRIESGEDERTEFKRSFDTAETLLPVIVGMANGPSEGWVIFGVDDEGNIVGVLRAEELRQDLINVCQQECEPPLMPEVEVVEIVDVGKVVVLHVQSKEQDKPYRQKKRDAYWLRRGGNDVLATPEEMERFIEEQYRIRSPLLQKLTVRRFRSLYDVMLSLKPLNIIIGPNASGKSNLFHALRFVRDVVVDGKWKPYDETGSNLLWYGMDETGNRPDRFTIELISELPEQRGRLSPAYRLTAQPAPGPVSLIEENANLKLSAIDREPVSFIERQEGKVQYYVESEGGQYALRQGRLSPRVSALREYGRDATFPPLAGLYSFIEGWRFFDIDAQAARQSSVIGKDPDRIPALSSDGSNLSAFLYALVHRNGDHFDEIRYWLARAINFVQTFESSRQPSLTGGPGKASLIFSEKAFAGLSIPPESMSDGTIRLLAHMAALLGDPHATLISIEEPDHGLHPHLMLRLADAIRSVVDVELDEGDETNRPQILLTTHSPDFMNCFDLEKETDYLQVFVAERDVGDGKTRLVPVNAVELAHWLKEYRLGDLVRMGVTR